MQVGWYTVTNLIGAPNHQSDMLERSFLIFTLACFIEDSGHGLPSASIAAPPMSAY